MSASVVPMLEGLRVVDASSWIAGAYCAKLLADVGAAVTRLEPETGHPLRGWSAAAAARQDAGEPTDDLHRGLLYDHLTTGHTRAEAHRHREVLAHAEVCIWSPGSALEHPDSIAAQHRNLVVVAITPFGLRTSWHDRPATDLTLQAWSGGVIGLGRGHPDRPPVHVGGQVGEWLAGTSAAIAALAAHRGATPGVVDLSMLEVAAQCLTYFPVTFHDVTGRPMRKGRAPTIPGVAAARDGLVGLGVGTGQQWLDFCAMTGHPEWAQDVSLFSERGALAEAIEEWVGAHDRAEVLDLASAFRLPNAPIVHGANAFEVDHLVARGALATPPDGVAGPRSPLRVVGTSPNPPSAPGSPPRGASRSTDHADHPGHSDHGVRGPCDGLRVLDMTAFWAGPSATHHLALLGAEVIHLESVRRPDGARMIGASPRHEQHWERGPIYAALNTNKRSVTLDFSQPAGLDLLRRLIATCDVVVENYTPRVLDQIGLDHASLQALRPGLVVVRMPGFGLDGPWRDNAAFAFVIEDASGLTWLTGHPDQHPVEPYCVGDSNAGLHGAFAILAAVAHRDRTGVGLAVESAMVDAALAIAAEQFIEHHHNDVLLQRAGNAGPMAAPQDLYPCAGPLTAEGEPPRVAIAVATDQQWQGLRRALGDPAWAASTELDHVAGRRRARATLDAELTRWCATRTTQEVLDALWPAGVPVAEVRAPHQQADLAPLAERGFFETVDHPVMGPARYATLPFRLPGAAGPQHTRRAPLLGEHNDPILDELGVDEAERRRLAADHVIGTTLVGAP